MITTLSMVRIGKTHGNLMVDLNSYACRKLVDRATRVVQSLTDTTREEAGALLKAAKGKAKTAIVMGRLGVSRTEAERTLAAVGGKLRAALGE